MYSIVTALEFNHWLEEEMKARGWSQADLAREANVSRGAIGNILREERKPGKTLLIAIANAFGLPPEVVFRKAGMIPPKSDGDPRIEIISHLMASLDDIEKDDVVAYVQLKVNQKAQRDQLEELQAKIENIPPERGNEILDLLEDWLMKNNVIRGKLTRSSKVSSPGK